MTQIESRGNFTQRSAGQVSPANDCVVLGPGQMGLTLGFGKLHRGGPCFAKKFLIDRHTQIPFV
jgi:hypothetical protein